MIRGNKDTMSMRNRIPFFPGGNRLLWVKFYKNSLIGGRRFSNQSNNTNKEMEEVSGGMTREEAYRQLQNLDFMGAARILFTAPPKRKKFGLDFHLVQLFFACLPSLAVYLVAQYARSDMKKMDSELHMKRKKTEEKEKATEMEKLNKEKASETELLKVKDRLHALEDVVNEIAEYTKKISQGNFVKVTDNGSSGVAPTSGSVKQFIKSTNGVGVGKESVAATDKCSDSEE